MRSSPRRPGPRYAPSTKKRGRAARPYKYNAAREIVRFIDKTLHIGGVAVTELIEQFDSPLYVYDAEVLRQQIRKVTDAFAALPFLPFYAAKANANLALLRMIEAQGFGCDAVSPGEVFLARQAGFSPDRIWFTCSNVSDEDLTAIQDASIVINVNSMSEIDRVIRLELPNPVALRLNPEVGAGHHRDVITGGYGVKFGIDLAEIEEARALAEAEGLKVVGLHAHIGSGIDRVKPLLESARKLLGLLDSFSALQFVNFGGGFSVPYKPAEAEFPIDEYGAKLAELSNAKLRTRGLRCILEPGRYVVASSGVLLTRVTAKRISSGFEWIGCDTGFNHLARPTRYGAYHHILNATNGGDSWLRENLPAAAAGSEDGVLIAGNICESGDVFTRDGERLRPRPLPPTKVGDLLAICDVGAYGFSMASHYNARLLPAEVLVEGGQARIIRERQKLQDLLQGQSRMHQEPEKRIKN
jgi:diaminopimelate decarboxylase